MSELTHAVTLTLDLTADEYRVVARDAAGMISHLNDKQSPLEWGITDSLITLLKRAIREEAAAQQARDNAVALLRRLPDPAPEPDPVPAWLKALEREGSR